MNDVIEFIHKYHNTTHITRRNTSFSHKGEWNIQIKSSFLLVKLRGRRFMYV